ncbi:MAG TPA: cupin domain-containing protein, partial [Longimicrobium sp.]|nr:cupin domain-containing protein [Longimicrobium sp.]
MPEESGQHPLNPRSQLYGHRLGDAVGLQRLGVAQLRIPPGKESFILHTHACEEEWLYVLSGRARVQLDDDFYDIGPGDFVGFPTPSVAHHLTNPFAEDFVYLAGGER